jgi:phage-related tail protein
MYFSQIIALLFAATTTIALPIPSGSISNQAGAGLEIGDDMLVKRGILKNAVRGVGKAVGGAVKKTAGVVGKAADKVGKVAGVVGKVAKVVGKGASAVGKVANKIGGKK